MVELKINGKNRSVKADPGTPLLWVLRDELNLKGTKFGCGAGLCGACTVHVNGEAVRSCIFPVESASGEEITTIEGLDPEGAHPLQQAWNEKRVPQCGYCQSGMIMSAAALIKDDAALSEEEIRQGITNICRCGTYNRISDAIQSAMAGKPAAGEEK